MWFFGRPFLLILGAGVLGAAVSALTLPMQQRALVGEAPADGVLRSGEERVVVFVASSSCGASRYPQLPAAFAKIRNAMEQGAAHDGVRLSFVGVAPEWDAMTGISFLKGFGHFDEFVAGRNWLNSGVSYYMASDTSFMAMPQIIVLQRHVQADTLGIRFSDQRILTRVIGARTIAGWASNPTLGQGVITQK